MTDTSQVLEDAGITPGADPFESNSGGVSSTPAEPAPAAPVSPEETLANPTDWRAELPADMQTAPAFQKYQSVEALAKAHLELESLRGTSLRIPGPDATEDAWGEYYKKAIESSGGRLIPRPAADNAEAMGALMDAMGRPEAPTAYQPPDMGESGPELDEATLGEFREAAHGLGLTQQQFEALVQFDAQRMDKAITEQRSTVEAQQAEIAAEWGVTYEPRVNAVVGWIERTGGPTELRDAVAAKQIGGTTLQWLHNIVQSGSEAPQVTQQGQGAQTERLTPGEADARIHETLEAAKGLHPTSDRYKELMAKIPELMAMKTAGQKDVVL